MLSLFEVDIPHEQYNTYVMLPKDAARWLAHLEHILDEEGYMRVVIDTLAMGCGGIAIAFGADSPFESAPNVCSPDCTRGVGGFGWIMSVGKARELRDALDAAIKVLDEDTKQIERETE